jgi:hypothetical protein
MTRVLGVDYSTKRAGFSYGILCITGGCFSLLLRTAPWFTEAKDLRLKEPSGPGWHLTAANLCESPLYEGKAPLYQCMIDLTFPL